MKVIKIFSACLFLLPFVSCTQVTNDKGDTAIEKKVEALLSKMTLEEKLGQMNQITSYGNIEDMSGLIKQGGAGSILNETDPVRINALQRVAIEESRLSIPLLMARDVIHGFKTIFPIPLGQAASFNPQVAEDGARVAAIEASSVGIRWTFAPMIDIARDPRWGRMAEGCGEDTYLTTVMGVAMVKGFQGDSLNSPTDCFLPETLCRLRCGGRRKGLQLDLHSGTSFTQRLPSTVRSRFQSRGSNIHDLLQR